MNHQVGQVPTLFYLGETVRCMPRSELLEDLAVAHTTVQVVVNPKSFPLFVKGAAAMDTQELLETPMKVDDGLAQKMLADLEESEGKFQNALN